MQHRLRLSLWLVLFLLCLGVGMLWAQQLAQSPGTTQPPAVTTANPPTETAAANTAPAESSSTTTPPSDSAQTDPAKENTPDELPAKPPALNSVPPGELPVFGRQLFKQDATAGSPFEPNLETPVPPDYVLGSGDKLSVVCWYGSTEYERSNATITPTGDVYLKMLGSIPLAQKTLQQAEQELKKRYSRYYTKFDLNVQLVGRRTIPIFVMGEVQKPAKYLLSSLATVFTALYAANGPSDIGSLRKIRLMRGQKTVAEIDTYAYLLRGQSVDLPLKPGDTVFVPVAGKVVALAGEVRRPAKYELRDKDTLADAMTLAGGTTATSAERIRVSRVSADHKRQVIKLALPADAAFALRDGDEITVDPVLSDVRNAVYLQGAVNRPGAYPIDQAGTVSSLMALAEGTAPDAYLEQAIIERKPENANPSQIPVNLRAILSGEKTADVELQPRDTLHVYNRNELAGLLDTVSVEGQVVKPGNYPYQPGMKVSELIRQAFGATTEAYFPKVQLYRYPVGGQPQMVTVDLAKALAHDEQDDRVLLPRDRLVVRSREEVQDLVVTVEGEVNKPGGLKYFEGMKISDAVFLVGGLKPDVALDQALLIRLNEETYAEELTEVSLRGALAHDAVQDLPLRNHDRLIVYPIDQMGELRMVKVEGAVVTPSTFPFTGGMRISHLVFLAKGLRQDAFAQRANLYRLRPDNTTEIIPVDLVKAMSGTLDDTNPVLQPRDRLVVATRNDMEEPQVVKIDGFVRHPGEYPLTVGMKLSDLVHLAGSLKPDAEPVVDLYRLSLGKVHSSSFPVQIQDNGVVKLSDDPLLQPNDLVSIRGNAEYVKMTETVSIEGEVNHPGTYPAYEGSRQSPVTLYQLVKQAEGLLPNAYAAGIVLYRQQAAIHTERQQLELIRTMTNLDAAMGIASKSGRSAENASTPSKEDASTNSKSPSAVNPAVLLPATEQETTLSVADLAGMAKTQNVSNISQSLAKVLTTDNGNTVVLVIPPRSMQEQQFNLSIPLNAEPIIAGNGRRGDVKLEPGDIIYVPKRPTTVTVLGGVINNGSVVYDSKKRLDDYIAGVGGLSPDGNRKSTIIMRMNGLVLPYAKAKSIQPGDIIIVPTKHMMHAIHAQGPIERILKTVSELALSYLPFKK